MGLAKMLSEEDGSKQSHQLENEKNSYCDLQYINIGIKHIYIYIYIYLLIFLIFLITKFIWGLLRGGNILMLV